MVFVGRVPQTPEATRNPTAAKLLLVNLSGFSVVRLRRTPSEPDLRVYEAVEKLKTKASKRTYSGEVSFPRKRESRYVNGLLDARFHGHDEFDLLRVC